MDKKSKIFFLIFLFLIIGSIALAYYKIVVLRDYIIQAEATCDPYTENCFVYVCDPEIDECTGDPTEDTSYYKLINRNAKNIPLCNPDEENCDALVCPSGEAGCAYALCDMETVTDGVTCNDPTAYTASHPLQGDESENNSGDETEKSEGDTETIDETINNDQAGNNDVMGTPDNTKTLTPQQ